MIKSNEEFIIQEKAGKEVRRFKKIKSIGKVAFLEAGRVRGGLPMPGLEDGDRGGGEGDEPREDRENQRSAREGSAE